ncbi:transcription repressor NadR [Bacillaceae bacterium SIJ1]|uniref:transcription repressor NadR n=1 Tax=Litoribacterium kuwaitense TaxID=1398745 RepID=UPI0013EDC591|nr:transcription repressor NadR [Litoribacterium kuwaitense]NGP45475.1 transcription repressor NadR [Litoribacterium kuwaitense]
MSGKKLLGEERRQAILKHLQQSHKAHTGSALAQLTNVSRQVIVQDISLLKARGEPIIATSEGYLYLQKQTTEMIEKTIVVDHQKDDTEKELSLIVQSGCQIKDVTVLHPVYGEIVARLEIATPDDVNQFVEKIKSKQASLLLRLTGGLHLHTIVSLHQHCIDQACVKLREAGFLVEET